MKISMHAVIFAVVLFFAIGCNNRTEELQQQNTALQSTNTQLSRDLNERDQYIGSVTDSINAVYTSIEGLKAAESSILKEQSNLESTKKLTQIEIRARLGERLNVIRAVLSDDHKRIRDLQSKLAYSKKQYAGLKKLVENLTQTLAERDQAIADLTKRVQGLEQDVKDKELTITEKNTMISQKDSILGSQYSQITTSYYITGTKGELEKMGIIKKEGGFPWGLFGSTTTLASGFDTRNFKPINNTAVHTIQVDGRIDEIIPKRNADYYQRAKLSDDKETLTISAPDQFWKEQYLVIITDRPATSVVITGMVPVIR